MSTFANPELFIASFEAGDAIILGDNKLLPAAETLLAEATLPIRADIDPEIVEAGRLSWEHRLSLDKQIVPKGFYGRLTDIVLEIMPDPLTELVAFKPKPYEKLFQMTDKPSLVGFYVTASLVSTADPNLGISQRPVWLVDNTARRNYPSRVQIEGLPLRKRIVGPERGQNRLSEFYARYRRLFNNPGLAGVSTVAMFSGSPKAVLNDGGDRF